MGILIFEQRLFITENCSYFHECCFNLVVLDGSVFLDIFLVIFPHSPLLHPLGAGAPQGRKADLGWWLMGTESIALGMAWCFRSHCDQSVCGGRSRSRIRLWSSRLDLNSLPLPLRPSPKGSSTSPNNVTSWMLSVQTASEVLNGESISSPQPPQTLCLHCILQPSKKNLGKPLLPKVNSWQFFFKFLFLFFNHV